MAEFNPTAGRSQPTPDFTGSSRGVHFDNIRSDTSLADLFQGLGNAIKLGYEAHEKGVVQGIENELTAQVDELNNQFGVQARQTLESGMFEGKPATPTQLLSAQRHLQGLYSQVQQGKLSETHWLARGGAILRGMRAKYPGYSDEIDQMMKEITGVDMANSLRRAQLQDFAAGAGDEQRARESRISKMVDGGSLPDDFAEREQSDNPYTKLELDELDAKFNRVDAENRRNEAAMSQARAKKELQTAEVSRNLRTKLSQKADTFLETKLAKHRKEMEAAIQAGEDSKPWTDQERAALALEYGKLEASLRNELTLAANQPWGDSSDPADTYRSNLPPAEIEAAINESLARLHIIRDQHFHKDYGHMIIGADYLKQRENDQMRAWLDKNPVMEELGIAGKVLGADVLSTVIQTSPAFRDSITNLVRTNLLLGAVKEVPDGDEEAQPSLANDLEELRSDQSIPDAALSNVTKSVMDDFQRFVNLVGTDKELPPEVLSRFVKYYFGPKNYEIMSKFKDREVEMKYFTTMASPSMTKQMIKLRDAGDTESWDVYQKWIVNSYRGLFSEQVRTIQKQVVNPNMFDIHFNPETKQFTFVPDPNMGAVTLQAVKASGEMRQLQQSVDDINRGIRVVSPIIEANGMNPAEQVIRLMEDVGLDLDAPEMQQTLPAQFMDALQREVNILGQGPDVWGQSVGARIRDGTEQVGKSIWEQMRPFSPQFRSPEERGEINRATEPKPEPAPVNPALDERLMQLSTQYPQAASLFKGMDKPPVFEELGFLYRSGIAAEAKALGVSPQEFINRGFELAKPKTKPVATPKPKPQASQDAPPLPKSKPIVEIAQTSHTPVSLAQEFLGYSEADEENNNALSEYIKKTAGLDINPAKTAWCAAFVNAVLADSGIEGTGKLNAKSFLDFGTEVTEPEVGDIVVLHRGSPGAWTGHVGFFQGYDEAGNIRVLGGNQGAVGKGKVSVKSYNAKDLLGFRRPPTLSADMPEKDKEVYRKIGLPQMAEAPIYQKLEMWEIMR